MSTPAAITTVKTAIVTGAGTGIGRAAALSLLGAGWNVVLAGRTADKLQATADMAQAGSRALAHPTDVTQHSSVVSLFDTTVAKYGRVDCVFNNAGMGTPPTPLEELDVKLFETVVQTNLVGMYYCIREAFRVMKTQSPQGGRIINNGSISATAPRPHSIAYTSTKHAVTGMTKAASLDGRRYNIAVGQIDIGNAATEMTERMASGVLQANGEMAVEARMDVNIVGQSVLYMASLPLEANVLYHTVMATKMPLVGRG
jgi:NAD(P)-dependent dehydrogenase (short-subunit alcohol dehydrogenase family)